MESKEELRLDLLHSPTPPYRGQHAKVGCYKVQLGLPDVSGDLKKKKKKKGKKEKEIAVHAALILLWGKHALYEIPEYYLFLLTWAQQAAWSCPILKIGIEVHLNKAIK